LTDYDLLMINNSLWTWRVATSKAPVQKILELQSNRQILQITAVALDGGKATPMLTVQ